MKVIICETVLQIKTIMLNLFVCTALQSDSNTVCISEFFPFFHFGFVLMNERANAS